MLKIFLLLSFFLSFDVKADSLKSFNQVEAKSCSERVTNQLKKCKELGKPGSISCGNNFSYYFDGKNPDIFKCPKGEFPPSKKCTVINSEPTDSPGDEICEDCPSPDFGKSGCSDKKLPIGIEKIVPHY
jgi:hypothetical protein